MRNKSCLLFRFCACAWTSAWKKQVLFRCYHPSERCNILTICTLITRSRIRIGRKLQESHICKVLMIRICGTQNGRLEQGITVAECTSANKILKKLIRALRFEPFQPLGRPSFMSIALIQLSHVLLTRTEDTMSPAITFTEADQELMVAIINQMGIGKIDRRRLQLDLGVASIGTADACLS